MEEIERRIFLRLTGEEAEYMQAVLSNVIHPFTLPHRAHNILDKLDLSLGRANRLAKVLETNPAKTLDDWESDDNRYGKGFFKPRKY